MDMRTAKIIALKRLIEVGEAIEQESVMQELSADGLIDTDDLFHPDVERVMNASRQLLAGLRRRADKLEGIAP